jgi:hypothetical protein
MTTLRPQTNNDKRTAIFQKSGKDRRNEEMQIPVLEEGNILLKYIEFFLVRTLRIPKSTAFQTVLKISLFYSGLEWSQK